jgi:hypothetical protein
MNEGIADGDHVERSVVTAERSLIGYNCLVARRGYWGKLIQKRLIWFILRLYFSIS